MGGRYLRHGLGTGSASATLKPLIRLLSLLLIVLCLPAAAHALPALKITDSKSQPLSQHMAYFVDEPEQLDIDEVLADPQVIDWTPTMTGAPNLGLALDPVWFGVRLVSPRNTRRLLSIAYPPLDHVDIYLARGGRVISKLKTGDQYPFGRRPIHHRDYVFPLELKAGTEYQLFIRVQTQGALHLPATLWDPDGFLEHTQKGFAGRNAWGHPLVPGRVLPLAARRTLSPSVCDRLERFFARQRGLQP